jgi:phage terminase large subunit-like protein
LYFYWSLFVCLYVFQLVIVCLFACISIGHCLSILCISICYCFSVCMYFYWSLFVCLYLFLDKQWPIEIHTNRQTMTNRNTYKQTNNVFLFVIVFLFVCISIGHCLSVCLYFYLSLFVCLYVFLLVIVSLFACISICHCLSVCMYFYWSLDKQWPIEIHTNRQTRTNRNTYKQTNNNQ